MTFNLAKLKKRPSYPFETIAVAIAFSPRLEAVLAEARRLAFVLDASLILIHVGAKTANKEEKLQKMMDKLGISPESVRVIWTQGTPADSILKICKLNIVDLLIIGALQKENLLTFYIGSLARSISRKAKCSVLLLTTPHVNASKPRKIIVNGVENPKTIHTINTALYFAESYDIREITVVKEVHTPALAMTIADESTAPEAKELKKSLSAEEEEKLHSVIEQCKTDKVKITEKTIKGKPGYAISKYARDKKADLLVINSPDTNLTLLDRIFTHDIEYILADLPCNVLIVHSRV
ncbi:MAG: universal stress protein [Bacteroidota bacterium]